MIYFATLLIASVVGSLLVFLLALALYAAFAALHDFWHRLTRPVLPPPTTVEYRRATDIAKWRALKGSGAERFKLSEWK